MYSEVRGDDQPNRVQRTYETQDPGQKIAVSARCDDGDEITLGTRRRLDTPVEVEYFRNGGILHTVLRKLCVE